MKLEQSLDLFTSDRSIIQNWIKDVIEDEYKNSVMKEMILPIFANERAKKLRPLISLYSYRLLAGENTDETKMKYLTSAIEISHNASLIVDDVFDRDELRRGEESFFVKYGTFAALSAAYNLSAFVFDLATRTENHKVVRHVGKVGSALSSALFLSKDLVSNKIISREFFMNVLYRKTTALFEASSECGAILASPDEKKIQQLKQFGNFYGTSYQLRDDVLGIIGKITDLGKLPDSDITNRFQSLITIEAMKLGSNEEIRILKDFYLKNKPINPEKIRSILIQAGAVEKVAEETISLRNQAINILNSFDDSRSKNMLMNLTNKINFDSLESRFSKIANS